MKEFYLLLDAARCSMPAIEKANDICKGEHSSLYVQEEGMAYLRDVAPYMYTTDSLLLQWMFTNGWENSWGVLVLAKANFAACLTHFCKFLMVKTEAGEEFYFRFYDPRVLKIFLPTCDKDQIIDFFGPVEKFILEGDTKETAIEFSHENGKLKQLTIDAEKLFGEQLNTAITAQQALHSKKKRNAIIDDDLLDRST